MSKQNTIIVSQITERKAIAIDCQFNGAFQDMEISYREINTNEKRIKLLNESLDASVKLAIRAAANAHIN